MNINRDEALRAKELAEDLMKKLNFTAARKLAIKAQNMDSSLENISRMVMVCDVHCAATEKLFGNELNWYSILQVEQNANDISIKKQYKKLALLLHPDKNQLPGAESAFKLIGEAQRTLLDKDKRRLHDIKRKTWREPAPAPAYRTQQVPNYHAQRSSVNMRPEIRHPQQKTQVPPAVFGHGPSFWTTCPFCRSNFEYLRAQFKRETICFTCKKQFTAFEVPYQTVPLTKSSCQTNPQQNQFPGQKSCNEPHKPPENPATGCSTKASFPIPGSTAKNNNGKRKRKKVVESSESTDSDTSCESEDVVNDDTTAAQDSKSNGGQQPQRRSVRSKQEVFYKENLSDDEVDIVNNNGEASSKDIDTQTKEEPEDKMQTHEDHNLTETLPNDINPKKEIKEDKVEISAGASDLKEDSSSESADKPNLITYDDPDFNDFDNLREKSCFKVGQIWALYDEEEGMPRFYALIRKVTTKNFSLKYVWLETEDDEEENETHKLPVSVGKYELGTEENTNECSIFSHLVCKPVKSRRRKFQVYPKKGETWALFKNWNIELSSDSDSHEYEFVEILSDHEEGDMLSVRFLSKVKGFTCVFRPIPKDGSDTSEIPPNEFCRFSHSIPSFKLTGTEGRGVTAGWFELDPAALPTNL